MSRPPEYLRCHRFCITCTDEECSAYNSYGTPRFVIDACRSMSAERKAPLSTLSMYMYSLGCASCRPSSLLQAPVNMFRRFCQRHWPTAPLPKGGKKFSLYFLGKSVQFGLYKVRKATAFDRYRFYILPLLLVNVETIHYDREAYCRTQHRNVGSVSWSF